MADASSILADDGDPVVLMYRCGRCWCVPSLRPPPLGMPTPALLATTVMRNVYSRLATRLRMEAYWELQSAWSSVTTGSSSLLMDACSSEDTTYETDADSSAQDLMPAPVHSDADANSNHSYSTHDSMPALVDSSGDEVPALVHSSSDDGLPGLVDSDSDANSNHSYSTHDSVESERMAVVEALIFGAPAETFSTNWHAYAVWRQQIDELHYHRHNHFE